MKQSAGPRVGSGRYSLLPDDRHTHVVVLAGQGGTGWSGHAGSILPGPKKELTRAGEPVLGGRCWREAPGTKMPQRPGQEEVTGSATDGALGTPTQPALPVLSLVILVHVASPVNHYYLRGCVLRSHRLRSLPFHRATRIAAQVVH